MEAKKLDYYQHEVIANQGDQILGIWRSPRGNEVSRRERPRSMNASWHNEVFEPIESL